MNIAELNNGDKKSFEINELKILLIKVNNQVFIIENKCGHFGVPLENGIINDDSITCSHHMAKFNLSSGEIMNHAVSQCDPIKIFNWKVKDQQIILFLPK